MDTFAKLPAMSVKDSPRSYGQGKMVPSEAVAAVIRMLSAYPEVSATCSEEYLATLAETLCQFPRAVATAATSPIHGVPKECKSFRPTAGQVFDWCEREAARQRPKYDAVAETLERRRQDQLLLENHSKESRADHVARLRAEGKLAFAGRADRRDISWFDRMTPSEAQAIQDRYKAEVRQQITDELFENLEAK